MKKRENGKDDESDELAFLQWKESLKKEGKLAEKADVLEKFWNITDDIDDDERFLRDYILNERWREKSEKGVMLYLSYLRLAMVDISFSRSVLLL